MAYINPTPELIDESDTSDTSDTLAPDYTRMDEVYFAFIDVLGFKKAFDDIRISKDETSADKFRDVFNYYFELMNEARFMEMGEYSGCYAGQTSDSLYFYTGRTDFLLEFMKIFSHFNLYAMSQNVFFRGGIAKGSLYRKKQYQFFGDSVIYAYLLENDISKYPIIMIDEKTNHDMQNMRGYNDMVASYNGRYYIKPFEFLGKDITLDISKKTIQREISADKIIKNVASNRAFFEYDAKNYEKYVFLQNELIEWNTNMSNGIE